MGVLQLFGVLVGLYLFMFVISLITGFRIDFFKGPKRRFILTIFMLVTAAYMLSSGGKSKDQSIGIQRLEEGQRKLFTKTDRMKETHKEEFADLKKFLIDFYEIHKDHIHYYNRQPKPLE